NTMAVPITGADKGTPAEAFSLTGCTLLSISGSEINDMFDYEFYSQGARLELAVMRLGKLCYLRVEKDELAPLGCQFGSYLIDQKHSCKNKCIFCFIDQLPQGMRKALYFKDDDERLSFLFGNYITLTNLSEHEVDRICRMHISPINISVHTVDPALRVSMMTNKHAGEVLRYIDDFAAAGINMNFQLVLCRGINDGDKLRASLEKLGSLHPAARSIAAVPIGLTRYRDNLPALEVYDKDSAAATLDILEEYGNRFVQEHGVRLVYPSDEWFLLAERPVPPDEYYDDYPQLENGVGMWRRLHDEFLAGLASQRAPLLPRKLDIVTGTQAAPLIHMLCDTLHSMYPNVTIRVHTVHNDFFGGNVGVTGLIVGGDIIAQLKGKLLSHTLCLPEVMLREEQDMFLDDVSIKQVEQALKVKVRVL
ncbi:MAG: DUF512 domain-containing protein, partial [Ruthenibacterium sp.]